MSPAPVWWPTRCPTVGVQQACDALDDGALNRFVAAFQRRSPGADS
ncbi:MAG: hypothetical protein ACR2HR_08290 [Euzebya sp.]